MGKARNYQDHILDEAQSQGKPVSLFLGKGVRVEGHVKLHDAFTILMETKEGQVLVYKRAITSLFPARLYYNPQKDAKQQGKDTVQA